MLRYIARAKTPKLQNSTTVYNGTDQIRNMEVVAYWQNIRYITLGQSILAAMRLLYEGKATPISLFAIAFYAKYSNNNHMALEKSKKIMPRPAEYIARQDRLKRSLEGIFGIVQSPQGQDVLGEHAVRLAKAVDCARVPSIGVDGVIAEVPDWHRQRIIPIVSLHPSEVAYTTMDGIAQEQYNAVLHEPDLDNAVKWDLAAMYFRNTKKENHHRRELSIPAQRSGKTTSSVVNMTRGGQENIAVGVIGQPSIVVNEKILQLVEMIDTLGHEMIHAADYLDYPVWMMDRDGMAEQHRLSYELRAHAIGWRVGRIALDQGYRMIGERSILASSEVVENIRQRVNGDFLSPNAFDPNDEIIKALDDAGLRGIYTRESH